MEEDPRESEQVPPTNGWETVGAVRDRMMGPLRSWRKCRCRQEAIDAEAELIYAIGSATMETGAETDMNVPVHNAEHGRRVAEALMKLIDQPAPGHDAGDK